MGEEVRTIMRVRMHISERLCKLCRSEFILDLEGLCNKDDEPVKDYPGDTGGICVICSNHTDEWGGSKLETSEPIQHLENVEKKLKLAKQKHAKYTQELIIKIRQARKNGESHIKIG